MNNIELIAIEELQHHPDNPRKDFGDLTELAESIKTNGIMQNLTVVRSEDGTMSSSETVVLKLLRSQDWTSFRAP